MREGLRPAEIIEIERFQALRWVISRLAPQRTENLSVIIGQQFVEDVDAKITCGTGQEHIADGLTLAVSEGVEVVFVQNGNESSVFGIVDSLLEGI